MYLISATGGLSYKYYQRIETGRINTTVRTLVRVARALGVPLEELFCDVGRRGPAAGIASRRS